MMANKTQTVQRGGEVQPESADQGSDADKKRHRYGVPEDASPAAPSDQQAEREREKRGDKGPGEEPGFGQGA